MSVRIVLLCCLVTMVFVGTSEGYAAERRPNVVLILADDQGWGDLSIHGNVNLSTPNIDRLARGGVQLEHFYVCQVCAPTRAELLTGRYYPRTGVSGVSEGQGRLNADETTVANLFQANGYATGAFGKWHNGTQPPLHPNNRGFAEFYGFTSGHWGHYFSPPMDHNGRTVRGSGFIVDDITNHALQFMESNRNKPFFCYVPLNTPHSPMMVPDNSYEKFADAPIEMRHRDAKREDLAMTRAALALCENIDENVGRILEKLGELELVDDTIVIYLSDNGPNSFRWNGGLKGRKGSIDEGGLRVPCFIRWPDRIPADTKVTPPTGAIDLLPTLLEWAGIQDRPAKKLDGRSLVSLIADPKSEWTERNLFSIKKAQVSVRSGRFRLDAQRALFDIHADAGQLKDVSGQHAALTSRLVAAAKRHANEMAAHFNENADRPFHVGYGRRTVLPARDGVPHGAIQRSARAPNNSFFTNWKSDSDSITWDVDVAKAGIYQAILHYTCAVPNVGARVGLGSTALKTSRADAQAKVTVAFDPPTYDKSKERVRDSHYWVKDFLPLKMGTLELPAGRQTLTLRAIEVPGAGVIDVHSVELILP
jgi:arylsulfatase A-like enzyme